MSRVVKNEGKLYQKAVKGLRGYPGVLETLLSGSKSTLKEKKKYVREKEKRRLHDVRECSPASGGGKARHKRRELSGCEK